MDSDYTKLHDAIIEFRDAVFNALRVPQCVAWIDRVLRRVGIGNG